MGSVAFLYLDRHDMSADYRIRRAAGIICWRLRHTNPATGELYTPAEAMAEASAREKGMSEAQLNFAYGRAQAAEWITTELNKHPSGRRLCDIIASCPLAMYMDDANCPGDEE
jgi:hypothetical protein